jgi:hypothetical protein
MEAKVSMLLSIVRKCIVFYLFAKLFYGKMMVWQKLILNLNPKAVFSETTSAIKELYWGPGLWVFFLIFLNGKTF